MSKSRKAGAPERPQGGGSFTRNPKTGALERIESTRARAVREQAREAASQPDARTGAETTADEKQEG